MTKKGDKQREPSDISSDRASSRDSDVDTLTGSDSDRTQGVSSDEDMNPANTK